MSEVRVLVADDDVDLQDLMVRRLRRMGLSADRAQDGTAAIDQIARIDYDLIVTDLYMPGASGLQILRAAKERDPHTQVLVVTGSATLENAIEALNDGAFAYMMKPLDHLSVFDNTVSRALEFRHLVLDNQRMAEIQRRRGDLLEDEVTERVQRLRRTHQELMDLLASLPDGVVVVEDGGRVSLSSPVADRWLSREAGEGAHLIQEFIDHVRQTMEQGSTEGRIGDQELRLTAIELPAREGKRRIVVIIHELGEYQEERPSLPTAAETPAGLPEEFPGLHEPPAVPAPSPKAKPVAPPVPPPEDMKVVEAEPKSVAQSPRRGAGGKQAAVPQPPPPGLARAACSQPHEEVPAENTRLWQRMRGRNRPTTSAEPSGPPAEPFKGPPIEPTKLAPDSGTRDLQDGVGPESGAAELEEAPPSAWGPAAAEELEEPVEEEMGGAQRLAGERARPAAAPPSGPALDASPPPHEEVPAEADREKMSLWQRMRDRSRPTASPQPSGLTVSHTESPAAEPTRLAPDFGWRDLQALVGQGPAAEESEEYVGEEAAEPATPSWTQVHPVAPTPPTQGERGEDPSSTKPRRVWPPPLPSRDADEAEDGLP